MKCKQYGIDTFTIRANVRLGVSFSEGLTADLFGFQTRVHRVAWKRKKRRGVYQNFNRCYEFFNPPRKTSKRIQFHFERVPPKENPRAICYHTQVIFVSSRYEAPWSPYEIEEAIKNFDKFLEIEFNGSVQIEFFHDFAKRPKKLGYDIAVAQKRARSAFIQLNNHKRGHTEGSIKRGRGAKTKGYRKNVNGQVYRIENVLGRDKLKQKYSCESFSDVLHLDPWLVFCRESAFNGVKHANWKRICPNVKRRNFVRKNFLKYGRAHLIRRKARKNEKDFKPILTEIERKRFNRQKETFPVEDVVGKQRGDYD